MHVNVLDIDYIQSNLVKPLLSSPYAYGLAPTLFSHLLISRALIAQVHWPSSRTLQVGLDLDSDCIDSFECVKRKPLLYTVHEKLNAIEHIQNGTSEAQVS